MNYKMLFISLFLVMPLCQAKGKYMRLVFEQACNGGSKEPLRRLSPFFNRRWLGDTVMVPLVQRQAEVFTFINKDQCSKIFNFQVFSLENARGKDGSPAYSNQDRGIVGTCAGRGVIGIFDGHGKETGGIIAQYVRDNLPLRILGARTPEMASSLCLAMQQEIEDKMLEAGSKGGTTGIMGVVQHHKNDQFTLSVVNVGDSRAIRVSSNGKVTELSHDHKPTDPKEFARIQQAGGIVRGGYVYNKYGYGLALSRSFGDLPAHDNDVITAKPEINIFKLLKGDMLVFASDGLWDVLSNQEVADFILANIDLKTGFVKDLTAENLVDEARRRGSRDDITVIIFQV